MTARITRKMVEDHLRFTYRLTLDRYAEAVRAGNPTEASRLNLQLVRLAEIAKRDNIPLGGDR